MAWFCSSNTNDGLIANLKRHKIVKDERIIQAFAHVNRACFLPVELQTQAYEDGPLRQDCAHHSAPHMYAQALELLELHPGLSFLNVGSGTGYLSCVAGVLLGNAGVNHGIELHDANVALANKCVQAMLMTTTVPFSPPTFTQGDAYQLKPRVDDVPHRTYDRIYVGAGANHDDIAHFARFLAPGGCMIGPFENQLLKVVKDAQSHELSLTPMAGVAFAGLVVADDEAAPVAVALNTVPSLQELCAQAYRRQCDEEQRSCNARHVADLGLPRACSKHLLNSYPVLLLTDAQMAMGLQDDPLPTLHSVIHRVTIQFDRALLTDALDSVAILAAWLDRWAQHADDQPAWEPEQLYFDELVSADDFHAAFEVANMQLKKTIAQGVCSPQRCVALMHTCIAAVASQRHEHARQRAHDDLMLLEPRLQADSEQFWHVLAQSQTRQGDAQRAFKKSFELAPGHPFAERLSQAAQTEHTPQDRAGIPVFMRRMLMLLARGHPLDLDSDSDGDDDHHPEDDNADGMSEESTDED
eukprot:TRINITY_DN8648_c0_g1_i2.p1 TRINITY_DN8648_c0_g1~~TRINITY_DN8648_c0_g1_i2.p1  ORF type:complete len:534 (+),score=124.49 TRINITY_DN8648_c0_g1_i2:27-1604(+)